LKSMKKSQFVAPGDGIHRDKRAMQALWGVYRIYRWAALLSSC
jgi:hypothetical protein